MSLTFDTASALLRENAAWRLLRSDHAPLVVSFLYRVFIERNQRVLARAT